MADRYYMHTLDERPAYFDGEQIVFAERRDHWRDEYPLCVLATSVEQIRSEQSKSRKYRHSHKWDVPRYDFVVVSLKPGYLPAPKD